MCYTKCSDFPKYTVYMITVLDYTVSKFLQPLKQVVLGFWETGLPPFPINTISEVWHRLKAPWNELLFLSSKSSSTPCLTGYGSFQLSHFTAVSANSASLLTPKTANKFNHFVCMPYSLRNNLYWKTMRSNVFLIS